MKHAELGALLAYNRAETLRWKSWFERHPLALEHSIDVAGAGRVLTLLQHIHQVNLFFASKLTSADVVLPSRAANPPINEVFGDAENAYARFKEFLANADESSLAERLPVGFAGKTASRRKMILQALVHEIRHYAQLATALRQAGLKQDWNHDPIMHADFE